MSSQNKLKLVDLFAGTGAFSLAFSQTGKAKTVFANDFMDSSEMIYNLNHPEIKMTKADIFTVPPESIPSHDILCAGFNCQPFSIAGKQLGFEDERSNSFWKLVRVLEKHKTPIIVLENVKNLTSHDKGRTFKIICKELDKLGYHYKYKILNTCEVTDVPQNRERIYIVGFTDRSIADKFDFDDIVPDTPPAPRPITDFLEDSPDTKYYYTDKLKVYPKIKQDITKHVNQNVLYQFRRYYVRENKSKVCPTLTANMGTGGHNVPLLKDDKGIRKLTPRECFNLQGFPSDFKLPDDLSDGKLYQLAGNAVSVPVVQKVADKIMDLLN